MAVKLRRRRAERCRQGGGEWRRHQDWRAKLRTARMLVISGRVERDELTPEIIGFASTTRRRCSCWMCQPEPGSRKPQNIRASITEREQKEDVWEM